MAVPLHYQVSEYDCVPTTFINAIACLFERTEVPPLVVRHIYAYSLDTVSRGGRLGRAGTSGFAIQLLGQWLSNYKTRHFSVKTEFLAGNDVHLAVDSPIRNALSDGGLALCNIFLGHNEWHFVLAMACKNEWLEIFDPYQRKLLRGLAGQVRFPTPGSPGIANLEIHCDHLDTANGQRFSFGDLEKRECLLIWRTR